MSPSQRKRSPADCPFTVIPVSKEDEEARATKRRKGDLGSTKDPKKPFFQVSPFKPAGSFRLRDTSLDSYYYIEPRKDWVEMTQYNSVSIGGFKYPHNSIVFVANDEAFKRLNSTTTSTNRINPLNFWVARILEIRAADESHAYARVCWLYSPDELPAAIMDGKKTSPGREPHHGTNELVVSNHMDIINVVSIVQIADVSQWIESDDDGVQEAMYWRQAFDYHTSQLSSIELICSCRTPANPDKILVGCTSPGCEKWIHMECLRRDVLNRVYNRLGRDLPHVDTVPKIDWEEKQQPAPAPLSPPKFEHEQSPPTFNNHAFTAVNRPETQSQAYRVPTPLEEEEKKEPRLSEGKTTKISKDTTTTSTTKTKRKVAPGLVVNFEQLFKAEIRVDGDGPPICEVTDLRKGIVGGQKTWTESLYCLLCNALIE